MITYRERSFETLDLSQNGRVLTVFVSDPPFSYVTPRLIADLDRLTRAVDGDDSIGAVVFTGRESGRFLTHADPTTITGFIQLGLPPLPGRLLGWGTAVMNGVLRSRRLATLLADRIGPGAVWVDFPSPRS